MSVLLSAYGPRQPRIWFDVEPLPSEHHAMGWHDHITPFQLGAAHDLQHSLGVDLQAETRAMFGDDTDFYQLNARSARALLAKLGRGESNE